MTIRSPSQPCVLLLGEPGNGKTFSLGSLAADPRVEKFFYLYTDPGGDESLYDSLQHYGCPIDKVHMHYVPPAAQDFTTLKDLVFRVNSQTYETLANMKAGINKQDHRQMFHIIEHMANFKCDRTGKAFGPADEWPDTWAFAFDSLTGLNRIAREATVGAKPTLHQGEWGVAMSMEENFIRKLCADLKGPRALIGHLDKQKDEITGRMTLQVSLLGNKLAPQVPHMFSDVIYCSQRDGDYKWATSDPQMSLKSRNLPLSDKLPPTFTQLLDKREERVKYVQSQTTEENTDGSGTSNTSNAIKSTRTRGAQQTENPG